MLECFHANRRAFGTLRSILVKYRFGYKNAVFNSHLMVKVDVKICFHATYTFFLDQYLDFETLPIKIFNLFT